MLNYIAFELHTHTKHSNRSFELGFIKFEIYGDYLEKTNQLLGFSIPSK